MRYFLRSSSLIIRGKFRICSSGPGGGIRDCTTLINHQLPHNFSQDPDRELEILALSLGLSYPDTAGLLTTVDMNTLCILSWDALTVFVTAGIIHPVHPDQVNSVAQKSPNTPGTINIIVIVQNFSDQALVNAVIKATEAKALALRDAGHGFAGTVTDAVIIASDGADTIRYAESATKTGQMIHETVHAGVTRALLRQSDTRKNHPSFFIRSGIGGPHWFLWEKEHCKYYPCHYEGQCCDFCYCPLYPCGDMTLGDWIEKPGRPPIWACTRCLLNHHPQVTRHLIRNPEASLLELKSLYSKYL